jgi:phage terminase Nu1 subunit (DNA packaging protein)
MTASGIDPTNPMFKPLTVKQAVEITGRSRRTLERWVKEGRLTKYEETYRQQVVILYNEDELAEIEQERNAAQIENHERIRQLGGRPGPRTPPAAATT